MGSTSVAIKILIAVLTNGPLFAYLGKALPHWAYVTVGSLYGGLQSSLCEIGLTWVAVLVWRELGRDANRAIGIGVGAGAFEAFLLGVAAAVVVLAALIGGPQTQSLRQQFEIAADLNPLFWLIATAERVIAILCHASTRALVLLGAVHRRPWMVFWGFFIFTVLDGVATGAHLSGAIVKVSTWWVELALLPAALVSVPILHWCYRQSGQPAGAELSATSGFEPAS